MDPTTPAAPRHTTPRPNPAFWAMIGIPAATVLASAVTLTLAYGGAEPELPTQYAWEGEALDRDFSLAAHSRELHLGADIEVTDDGRVLIQLRRTAAVGPRIDRLTLRLTHTTLPALDRRLTLTRTDSIDRFEGRTAALPAARWLVQLDDDRGRWRLRGRMETPGSPVHLGY